MPHLSLGQSAPGRLQAGLGRLATHSLAAAAWLVAGAAAAAATTLDAPTAVPPSPAAASAPGGSDRTAGPCATADLLQLAHEIALAIPTNPHEKDQARALEMVFDASLSSCDMERARRAAGQMSNWRRGVATARLAEQFHLSGRTAEVERHLQIAERIAVENEDWRRDRIRVAIARARLRMGQLEEAARMERDLEPSEAGKADAIKVAMESPEQFESRLEVIDRVLALSSFDLTLNHTSSLEELYRRYQDDSARREEVLKRVNQAVTILPLAERVHFLLRLAAIASELGDRTQALAFIGDAQAFAVDGQWTAEDQVPLMARVAAARHRAGDEQTALLLAEEAARRYQEGRGLIVDVFRAAALVPLAEALAAMERREQALAIYRLAVEEGAINPNARPRAVDLCRTACSMATHRVDADEALCRRMREIQSALGAPW